MTRFFFLLLLFLAIDVYFNWRVSLLTEFRRKVKSILWIFTALVMVLFVFLYWSIVSSKSPVTGVAGMSLSIIQGLYISKFIALVFFAIGDFIHLIKLGASKVRGFRNKQNPAEHLITRNQFLAWTGTIAGTALFGGLLSGIGNRYRYEIRKLSLKYSNLPTAFDGLKIVHISDIHCGSFDNPEAVKEGVSRILQLKPDLIVFTGDLVNNRASEMNGYEEIFGRLNAPLGVYSILGNHDYGDYVTWNSNEEKADNLQFLKNIHAQMGWKLLLNENIPITRDNETIGLIGVENWGSGNFAKYGKLGDACKGCEKFPFNILLSHDPSHWDAEVKHLPIVIDLTLSGHTHGMQFGVDNQFVKWSPVQWVYKQWAGLYSEGARQLYVNRGFGFIGYHGRLGILPEITEITLRRRNLLSD